MEELPDREGLERLIIHTSSVVWGEQLSRDDLEAWLANFSGKVFEQEYEQHLALWLLTNFVYYNEKEVRHLCRQLLREYLHRRLVRTGAHGQSVQDSLEAIRKDTRYHCLGRVGESGAFISYYFRKENSMSNFDFVNLDYSTGKAVRNIVLVDDVTLSGKRGQAIDHIKKVREKYFADKEIFVLTMLASTEAVEHLESEGIGAISAVTLDKSQKCFSETSTVFIAHESHKDNCQKVAEYYGKKLLPEDPLGYNDSQYLFGFFYNTPDNCLPIFWSEANDWIPIVRRYPKNYDRTTFTSIGRFV